MIGISLKEHLPSRLGMFQEASLLRRLAQPLWKAVDQNAAIVNEILRWNADIFALQECEGSEPYDAVLGRHYKFLGAAGAHRGYVQLYVRIRDGLHAQVARGEDLHGQPVVQASLRVDVEGVQRHWRIVAVHLPSGEEKSARRKILESLVITSERDDGVLLLGDLNAGDEEVQALCRSRKLSIASYVGPTWGAPRNKFHERPSGSAGGTRGLRYDWMLYRGSLCVEAYVLSERCVFSRVHSFFFLIIFPCLLSWMYILAMVPLGGLGKSPHALAVVSWCS